MTLSSTSKLHDFIDQNYAFCAWKKRSNPFKLFIDRNNRNTFLHRFQVELDVVKDGDEVIKITGDTTGAPPTMWNTSVAEGVRPPLYSEVWRAVFICSQASCLVLGWRA